MKFELAAMRLFFGYLRGHAGLRRPPSQADVSAADALLQNYNDYLRKDRGLTENSVHEYAPFIRDFLATQTTQAGCVSPESFDALIIQSFIPRAHARPVRRVYPAAMHGTPLVFSFSRSMWPDLAGPI